MDQITATLEPNSLGQTGTVLFVLQARNSAERRALEKRTRAYAAEHAVSPDGFRLVHLNRKNQAALRDAISREGHETLLVPMRLAWKIPDFKIDKPIKFRHFLFGDPRSPGGLRARIILARDPGRAQLVSGKPATLIELEDTFSMRQQASPTDQPEAFAEFVARQAAIVLENAERKVQGARYKLPRRVSEALRADPEFRRALNQHAEQTGESIESVKARARKYLKELIARPTPLFVDLRARLYQWILSGAYEGKMCYRDGDTDRLRTMMQNYPTLLLFTHKAYIDGTTPTNMLYQNDLPTEHVFAGQNLDLPLLGTFMRKSGAIYLRRSFQDNPLYKTSLQHYIGYLLAKRFPMSWAFEGTRSRLGKLMPPKYGLLKYVMDSAHDLDVENINIIPVVTSFDFIRDVEEYAREQAGGRKKPESLGWFYKFLKSMRDPQGRIYVDLGEPVIVRNAPSPDDKLALSKIAFQVAVEANSVTPLTLTSLLCFFLLQSAPRGMTASELQVIFRQVLDWAKARDIRLADNLDTATPEQVEKTIGMLIRHGVIQRFDDARERVYIVAPEKHAEASYYRNTIIHHFIPKATIELALLKVMEHDNADRAAMFWDEVFRLRDLFKFEFYYSPKDEYRAEIEAELTRTDNDWREKLDGDSADLEQLLDGCRPITPHSVFLQFTEAYSIVFEALCRLDEGEMLERDAGVEQAIVDGQQAFLLRRISSGASIAKTLFENAFKLADNLGLAGETTSDISARRAEILVELRGWKMRMEKARLRTLGEIENLALTHDRVNV